MLRCRSSLAVGAHGEDTEAHRRWARLAAWAVAKPASVTCQELVEAAFGIGKLGGFFGGHGQIGAAQAAEKAGEETLLEQIDGGLPVVLAGHGELIEVAASLSAGKDELIAEKERTPR